jgi:hypothetical protein
MAEETSPLRQALTKAFEEVEGKQNEAEQTEPEVTEQPPESTPVEVSGDETNEDIKKVSSDLGSDAADETGKAKQPPKEVQPAKQPIQVSEDAPPFWKAEDKVLWAKVSPEVRTALKKYEDMRNAAVARYKQAVNDKIAQWSDASWDEVFPPERVRALRLEQKTPASATKALWEWNDYLEEDPVGAIIELAKRYDLSPDDLTRDFDSAPSAQQSAPLRDPRVDELIANQQQTAKQQEIAQLRAQLDMFGSEKDASGKPLRPFWNDAKSYIKSILPLVYSENPYITDYEALHEAYNRAVYANPQVRTKLTSTTNTQVKFSDEKTQKAKEAAISLTGSSSRTVEPPKTARTAREAIEMAWREHSSR